MDLKRHAEEDITSGPPSKRKFDPLAISSSPLPVDHHALDQEVLAKVDDVPSILYDSGERKAACEFLWQYVVDFSPGLKHEFALLTHPFYREHEDQLANLITEAWRAKSFQRIRELAILREDFPRQMLEELSPSDRLQLEAAHAGFQAKFEGNNHQLLYELMDSLVTAPSNIQGPYVNALSIIQSSGMGKSRVVDAVATLKVAFPFNLREILPGGQAAYPPSDHNVRDFFHPRYMETEQALEIRYIYFFIALFSIGARRIQDLPNNNSESVAMRWRQYLSEGSTMSEVGPAREKFYSDVIQEANKAIKYQYRDEACDLPTALRQSCDGLMKVFKTAIEKFESQSKGKDMNGRDNSRTIFFMYFDDAHDLIIPLETATQERARSPFYVLGRVLSRLNAFKQFTVFLSTNSRLGAFTPPSASLYPDLRGREPTMRCPPYTELPFDTFARNAFENLKEQKGGSVKIYEVCALDFVVKFGRSLWAAQWNHSPAGLRDSIIPFAIRKLGELDSSYTKLAALAIRINLDFDTERQIAREIDEKLVESHLRVVFAVPAHGRFMRTGSPSEPLLVEAARQHLDFKQSNEIQFTAPTLLSDAFSKGYLARGDRGETLLRTLFILARDAVVCKMQNPPINAPIRVLDWLRALFHPKWHDLILKARPVGDLKGLTLAEAFDDAWVNFTHFVRAGDSAVVGLKYLSACIVRGMVFQCMPTFPVDVVAGIHHGYDNPLQEIHTSPLLARAKNRLVTLPELIDPTVAGTTELPVLSILHEFGAHSGPHVIIPEMPSVVVRSGNQGIQKNHYQIVAHGAQNAIYAVIPPKTEHMYKDILAADGLVED
ncbi:hypothetical protein D9615_008098 [Tricholomella constricta]|uniref:Uncharacterized protein n=1 Tax=Tricholomella constricta TaxID=117010 RepID=A0A8H5GW65_9AGAR|nr:hypothetical protein D9615_008098 [Tricholomella constricta]